MKKIKVSLLVKGNIIAKGDVVFIEYIEGGNAVTNSVSVLVDPSDDKLDMSEAVVVEGDMNVGSLNAIHGFVAVTGDVIAMCRE